MIDRLSYVFEKLMIQDNNFCVMAAENYFNEIFL